MNTNNIIINFPLPKFANDDQVTVLSIPVTAGTKRITAMLAVEFPNGKTSSISAMLNLGNSGQAPAMSGGTFEVQTTLGDGIAPAASLTENATGGDAQMQFVRPDTTALVRGNGLIRGETIVFSGPGILELWVTTPNLAADWTDADAAKILSGSLFVEDLATP